MVAIRTTTQTKRITAEELSALPIDGYRYELVEGELKQMPPAGEEHGYIAAEIAAELRNYVKAQGLGRVYAAETGFKLRSAPDTVRAPDVAFVSQARLDAVPPGKGYRADAPDLVIEVISPYDLYTHDLCTEVSAKVAEWLEVGCRKVVVVNPRTQEVLVHTSRVDVKVLTIDDVLEGDEVVPGWMLNVRTLFEG